MARGEVLPAGCSAGAQVSPLQGFRPGARHSPHYHPPMSVSKNDREIELVTSYLAPALALCGRPEIPV